MLLSVFAVSFTQVEGARTNKETTGSAIEGLTIAGSAPDGPRIIVDPGKTYQTILGFGSSLTEAAAYNYNLLPDDLKAKLIEELYGKTGARYSWGRMHIGSADFSLSEYQCVADGDETLATFSLDRDAQYVIPFAKAALAKNPDLTLFGSPWSPPAFMKTNKELPNGGALLKEYYPLYAQYITKWVQGMRDEGVKISAVTIQNEPAAWQPWESCYWSGAEEADYAVNNLRPTFDAAGLNDINIIFWDHNRGNALDRADETLQVAGAQKALWGEGLHWYGQGPWDQTVSVHEKYGCHIVTTEFCVEHVGPSDWPFDGRDYTHEIMGGLNNWVEAVTDWNVILDENGGPFHHRDSGCKAPIRVNSETKTYELQHMYWAFWHFSHFIDRGAKRIDWSCDNAKLSIVAAQNPDGSVIVVILNDTDDDVNPVVEVQGQFVQVKMIGTEIATVVLR